MHIGIKSTWLSPVYTKLPLALCYISTTAPSSLRTLADKSKFRAEKLRTKIMANRDIHKVSQFNENLRNDIQWKRADYERHGLDFNTRTKFANHIQSILQEHTGSRFNVVDVSMHTYAGNMFKAPLELAIIDNKIPNGLPNEVLERLPDIYNPEWLANVLMQAGFNGCFHNVVQLPSKVRPVEEASLPPLIHDAWPRWPKLPRIPKEGFILPTQLRIDVNPDMGFDYYPEYIGLTLPHPTTLPLQKLLAEYCKSELVQGVSQIFYAFIRSWGISEISPACATVMVIHQLLSKRKIHCLQDPHSFSEDIQESTATVAFYDEKKRMKQPFYFDVDTTFSRGYPDYGRVDYCFVYMMRTYSNVYELAKGEIVSIRSLVPLKRNNSVPGCLDLTDMTQEERQSQAMIYQPNLWRARKLVIQDPILPTRNLAESVTNDSIRALRYHCAQAASMLRNGASLQDIWGPYYQTPQGSDMVPDPSLPSEQQINSGTVNLHDGIDSNSREGGVTLPASTSRLITKGLAEEPPTDSGSGRAGGATLQALRSLRQEALEQAQTAKPLEVANPRSEGQERPSRLRALDKSLIFTHLGQSHQDHTAKQSSSSLRIVDQARITVAVPDTQVTHLNEPRSSLETAPSTNLDQRPENANLSQTPKTKALELPASVHATRSDTIKRIQRAVQRRYGTEYRVELFGSTRYGISSPTSDLDLVIIDPERPQGFPPGTMVEQLPKIYNIRLLGIVLREAGFSNVVCIPKATVPIVKFKDPKSGLDCDINVNEQLGLINTFMLRHYCDLLPVLRLLVASIKAWAKPRGLNNPSGTGPTSFSSYALMLMTIAFLQHHGLLPNLQEDLSTAEEDINKHAFWPRGKSQNQQVRCDVRFRKQHGWKPPPHPPLGELMREWFKFWAVEHKYALDAVDIRSGGIQSRLVPVVEKKKKRRRNKKDKGKEKATTTDLDESDNHGQSQQGSEFEQYLDVLSDAEDVEVEPIKDKSTSTGVEASGAGIPLDDNHGQGEQQEVPDKDSEGEDHEVLDISSNAEAPRKWGSQTLLVIDPFIRAKNVTGAIAYKTIRQFQNECSAAMKLPWADNGKVPGAEPPLAPPSGSRRQGGNHSADGRAWRGRSQRGDGIKTRPRRGRGRGEDKYES